jgi:maltoporin
MKREGTCGLGPPVAYFDRPALRLFATFATWSDGLKGYVAPRTSFDETKGWSFGAQVEAWW